MLNYKFESERLLKKIIIYFTLKSLLISLYINYNLHPFRCIPGN